MRLHSFIKHHTEPLRKKGGRNFSGRGVSSRCAVPLCALLLCGAHGAFAFSFGRSPVLSDPVCREAAAALGEAKKALDSGDFARLSKQVEESIDQGVAWRIDAGESRARAREAACAGAAGLIRTEIFHDRLRRHPRGVQGLWRFEEEGLEGLMSIVEGDVPDRFTVKMQVNLADPPYASGSVEGVGALEGRTLRVVDEACPEGPVTITFEGEKAAAVESEAFQACGMTGLGATFSGSWRRERK